MFESQINKNLRRPKGLFGRYVGNLFRDNLDEYIEAFTHISLDSCETLLEVGYGTGLGLLEVNKLNYKIKIYGIDHSKLMFATAKKATKDISNISLFIGDIDNYDFKDTTYSIILLMNVIYFFDNLESSIGKISSLLANNGKVVIDMASPELLKAIVKDKNSVFNRYRIEAVAKQLKKNCLDVEIYEYSKFRGAYFIIGTKRI